MKPMKLRNWLALGGFTVGFIGAAVVISSFLPHPFVPEHIAEQKGDLLPPVATLPDIEVSFLRCGSVVVPEWLTVRGKLSTASHRVAHSAVLIKHPRGTFLYDTGLCTDLPLFMMDQSFFFEQTLGRYELEQSIGSHLERLHLTPGDLDFAVLSHLHWDHVAGIPDLPGVPLWINRVEFHAASQSRLDKNEHLVRRLLCRNSIELLDFTGPAYAGFRSSYDIFKDGSLVLVPLPGHTPGQVGLFIRRAHGSSLFIVGDAAWSIDNYAIPATMHPWFWSLVTSDDVTAKQTLIDLYHLSHQHPEIAIIGMHDAQMQEAFMLTEQARQKIHSI
ncbi:MBL fold metallo-hydrolase [Dictyobacter arantiisoli]|uniref:MBL fold metallo-hydrolase n=1 Tax=Dictyobacter arantiisoli TaxID=2014874 RepID=A0A5A5TAY0_9CHLR|nr:MBL fold metallo-hydrolase [Dictyobacter arantiisoli]GCF08558.1 MBL fold metallo-hydrolase [Dictyobacter arantiisoli]